LTEVVAIASRDEARAGAAAESLGLSRAYGSYEALLADPDVDAIYNPLPNHLHLEWSVRAAEAGKHVLCEKPIGMNAAEVSTLIAARDRAGVKMQEAFMVRTAPQWHEALAVIREGRLGDLRSYVADFSYFNDDPANIRNIHAYGGGALMDIGCYLVTTSRMAFGEDPRRVIALVERDPASGVDTMTSMMLEFPSGHAVGTCGTRTVLHQRVQVFGTRGRLEVEIPFNAPNAQPCRIFIDDGRDVLGSGIETRLVETVDQYRVQGDEFSRAILHDTDVPYPLESSLVNMRVIDALFRSAETGRWESLPLT